MAGSSSSESDDENGQDRSNISHPSTFGYSDSFQPQPYTSTLPEPYVDNGHGQPYWNTHIGDDFVSTSTMGEFPGGGATSSFELETNFGENYPSPPSYDEAME